MTPVRRTVAMTVWAVAWAGLLDRRADRPAGSNCTSHSGTGGGRTPGPRRLRDADRPTARRQLLRLPWRNGDGRAAARHPRGLLQGAATVGAIVEPGKPEASTLLKVGAARRRLSRECLKGRAKLAQADIDVLSEWVRLGAAWPAPATAAATPVASHAKVITAEQRAFWSFAPLASAPPAAVRDTAWPRPTSTATSSPASRPRACAR